jgi:hypothetical protein
MERDVAEATAGELRALAARVPDGPPPVSLARQRGTDAAEAIAAALAADPTLAERQQRWLDVLEELLRRLTPLARQAASALERQRLDAAGQDAGHLGRINPVAPEELDAVSRRCTELAATITAAVLPDWDSPQRIRELSSQRLPHPDVLADIADQLRRAVAPALALPYPDPEAVRLAEVADQIAPAAGRLRLMTSIQEGR